jgi:hypothetical protein
MRQTNDWRLMGQERYLKGRTLVHHAYRLSNAQNDHDHCAFCTAKFMAADGPEILREGYSTPDGYHWICETCFRDFVELFEWKVGSET